jgi:signal peptidase I
MLLCLLLCSAGSAFVLHHYVLAVYVICGSSMSPALNDGDTALVNIFVEHLSDPERGEIVLVRDGFRDYATKRVVGLPGERVDIKDGKVYVNLRILRESYLPKETITQSARTTFCLGRHEYLVLGDNRSDSYDSRDYGPVSRTAIKGSYSRTFWACR